MMMRSSTAAALLCAGLMAAPGQARAETYQTCAGFIDTVPTHITTQGVWCLRHDVSTPIDAGEAILIDANNVTIDCNGFKIGGLAAGVGTGARGIHTVSRTNASIRNCNIRGFLIGVALTNGSGHVIEDNRLDGNTYIGIQISGDGSVVRRNRVVDTGLSTITPGTSYAIHANGSNDLLDNTVVGVSSLALGGTANAYGIYNESNNGGTVSGNRIRGVVLAGVGVAGAIYSPSSVRLAVTGNVVTGLGQSGSIGLLCGGRTPTRWTTWSTASDPRSSVAWTSTTRLETSGQGDSRASASAWCRCPRHS